MNDYESRHWRSGRKITAKHKMLTGIVLNLTRPYELREWAKDELEELECEITRRQCIAAYDAAMLLRQRHSLSLFPWKPRT